MQKNTILLVIIAALGGFIGGFWLANSINRSALNSTGPRPTGSTGSPAIQQTAASSELSEDEIRSKIADADNNPDNFAFQKELGTALYRYAVMKQDVSSLIQAIRILDRANLLNPKDFDVLVALGNAHFDIGFFEEDATRFQKAREVYTRALGIRPGDPDVSTDLGITYFLQKPPAYDKAVTELTKVSASNPKHERSLQFLTQTYMKQNKLADAEKTLVKLKSINPGNPAITELASQISAARSSTSK